MMMRKQGALEMRTVRHLAAATLLAGLFGCTDLEVTNPNNPDRSRTLANPSDVEALAVTQFQQIVTATHGSIARSATGMMTASLMNASSLANNGMGPRGSIPRGAISNVTGNTYAPENYAEYRLLSFVARNAADVIARAKADGFSLGAGRSGDEQRLKAWAHFVYGLSTGYLSLQYDSAAVPRPDDGPGFIPVLEAYGTINEFAMAQFDSALVYAQQAGTTSLPANWLTGPGGPEVPMARFGQVIRSYKAQVRAGVARNRTERDAVNWDAVIADATAGIQTDLLVHMNPSVGWNYDWLATTLHFRDTNWHQMPYYIIGMADVSGSFDAWLNVPRGERTPFTIVTPDLRFPQGATRTEQQRPSNLDDAPLPAGQYFRNRNPGKDQSAVGWEVSFYDHYRHRAFADAARIGAFPLLTRAEIDMLAAEGQIRRGNIAAAATLIDRYRVPNGLPALSGAVTTASQPVPGGANCVPRVPQPTGPTQCGNILEAMKWEKRLETAYTSWGVWFFDSRGWGDLPIGTALQWPVPVQDLEARRLAAYDLGGEGRPSGATESTYGYGVGSR
jgi:hypothetical protein